MEEKKSFEKKPFAKKPYRVDAKALESKGFEMIRYDRHESYAKTYRIDGRAFIGTINPVTGDRTISKAGPFASAKDIDSLRAAWDQLSADVLGPRPEAADRAGAEATATSGRRTVYIPDTSNNGCEVQLDNLGERAIYAPNSASEGWKLQAGNSIASTAISPAAPIYDVHDLTEDEDSVKCPHCGKSHYRVDSAKSTVLSMPTIVRDGRIIPQPDINRTTYSCTCLECGGSFETRENPLPGMTDGSLAKMVTSDGEKVPTEATKKGE